MNTQNLRQLYYSLDMTIKEISTIIDKMEYGEMSKEKLRNQLEIIKNQCDIMINYMEF